MNDITEFIPRYPEIKHYKNNLLNPYDGNFYNVLYHKKELYENKLEKIEKFPENGEFLKSQINFSRILSSYTPYNHILLMSEMGTGKTCASIALIEKILKSENSTFTGAMIFASGKGLLRNYKDEIVRLKEKIKSQNINMEEALAQLTVTNNETFNFKAN